MKLPLLLIHLLFAGSFAFAQTSNQPISIDSMPIMDHTPASTSTPLPDPQTWEGSPIDWCSTARQFTQLVTNSQTGVVTPKAHQLIQVGNGLNYIDYSINPAGVWRESEDIIELTTDGGAAAVRGQNKVYFSPGPLNSTDGAITIVTKSNAVLRTYPLGVYYVDPVSGKEVLLAAVQESTVGSLQPPNRVVYPSAFHSQFLDADLRVTCCKEGMECDIVVTRKPKVPPEGFGLNPATTVLQARHAWINNSIPQRTIRDIQPGLQDTSIDFGDMLFAPGKAFAWDGSGGADTNYAASITLFTSGSDTNQVPVGKSWQLGTPNILNESVRWKDVAAKLAQLPEMAKMDSDPDSSASRKLKPGALKPALPSRKSIQIARSLKSSPGFVLDYITVSGNGNYTFQTYVGANTYFLAGNNVFNGLVTFQSQCIIKESPGSSLILDGTVACQGTCAAPSILTSEDDNMYGDQIRQNCATIPSGGGPALWVWYSMPGSVAITGMNIRFAQTGIEFDGASCSQARSLINATIESCGTGVYANDCSVTIQNSITSSVTTQTSTASCGTIAGTWSSTCNQVSLQSSVLTTMQSLITSRPNPSIYSYVNNYLVGYNSDSLIYNIKGYTSQSPSNSVAQYPYQGAGTLITPKHAITAAHLGSFLQGHFRFIGKSGQHYDVVCTNQATVPNTDISVLTFSNALPADVEWVRILPGSAAQKLTFDLQSISNRDGCASRYLPCIACNQIKTAFPADLYYWPDDPSRPAGVTSSILFPTRASTSTPWGGDSGSPIFVVINNNGAKELALLGTWYQQDLVLSSAPTYGSNTQNNLNAYLGCQLNVGSAPIGIEFLARWSVANNNSNVHNLKIIDSSGATEIASGSVNLTSIPIGGLALSYTPPPFPVLSANTSYYLVSQESNMGDLYYNWNSCGVGISGAIDNRAVSTANVSPPYSFTTPSGSAQRSFGPVGVYYYIAPHSGTIPLLGESTAAINQIINPDGYSVAEVDLSSFPGRSY